MQANFRLVEQISLLVKSILSLAGNQAGSTDLPDQLKQL